MLRCVCHEHVLAQISAEHFKLMGGSIHYLIVWVSDARCRAAEVVSTKML